MTRMGSGRWGKQNTFYLSRFGLTRSGPFKGGRESKPQLLSSLLVMTRSSMWSALARFFCSAHVGTGSETTVEQESQHTRTSRAGRRKQSDARDTELSCGSHLSRGTGRYLSLTLGGLN
jgi:hypothetical protein